MLYVAVFKSQSAYVCMYVLNRLKILRSINATPICGESVSIFPRDIIREDFQSRRFWWKINTFVCLERKFFSLQIHFVGARLNGDFFSNGDCNAVDMKEIKLLEAWILIYSDRLED